MFKVGNLRAHQHKSIERLCELVEQGIITGQDAAFINKIARIRSQHGANTHLKPTQIEILDNLEAQYG